MGKIAVDIVLIPPREIIGLVLEINARAVADRTARIALNEIDRIPHLSLLMGVLDDKDLPRVEQKLSKIALSVPVLPLMIDRVENQSFVFERNDALQSLHESIVNSIDPLFTHNASANMYLDDPDALALDANIQYWVNNFVKKHSFAAFWPHITIHSPEENPCTLPIACVIDRMALCHLGLHNTCRRVLCKTALNEQG